jgi:O-antigen ligase
MLYYFSLLFILYLPFQIALNPASGVDLASARVLAITLFIAWSIDSLKKKKIFIANNLTTIFILSFLFIASFSIIFAENQIWGWKKLLFLLSFFPLYFVFSALAQEIEKRQKIATFLVWSAFFASAIALFQFGLQFMIGLDNALNLWRKIMPLFLGETFSQSVFGYSSWLVNIGGQTYFRAIAFFPDPHMLSLFLGLIFPWSVLLSKEKNKLHGWIVPATILLADILTFSRGGYIGLISGTIFASLLLIRKWHRKYFAYGIITILIFLAIFTSPNPLSQRLRTSFNPAEGSNQERLKNWNQAWQIIQNNPLLGTGLGNYSLAVKPTATEREPIYAHNLFLDITAETGILSGLIFIFILLTVIWNFARSAKYATFYWGGVWGLAIFFFHSLFETGLYSVHVLPVLIIILALNSCHCEERSDVAIPKLVK